MKFTRILIAILFFSNHIALQASVGEKAAQTLVNGLGAVVDESLPTLLKISQECGKNAGTGALKMIGAGVTKTTTALSTGASKGVALVKAAAASPFAPYVVVGVGTGYVVYKVYYHYNPTTKMKTIRLKELSELSNAQAELNEAQMRVIQTKIKLMAEQEKLDRLLAKA